MIFDRYENLVREKYPDHLILELVGWDDTFIRKALDWQPIEYQALDIKALKVRYPKLPWDIVKLDIENEL